jgi:cell division protease FtsH
MGHQRNYSEEVAAVIDAEVKGLLGTAHQEAFNTLEENRDVLDALVLELLDKETLDKAEIARVFEPLRLHPPRPAWTGSPDRNPSEIPPIEIPQAIRDRVSANGLAGLTESGVILTPPGAGGDVHGDTGLGGPAATPPTEGA